MGPFVIAPNFCVNCGTDDIEYTEELCEVCQEAVDFEELLILSRRMLKEERTAHNGRQATLAFGPH
ncbi:MAG: hypothetical protein ABIG61_17870 [Planctomycetota bacterium]